MEERARHGLRLYVTRGFRLVENRLDIEKADSVDLRKGALHGLGVAYLLPHHLIAPANGHNLDALFEGPDDTPVEAMLLEQEEVFHRIFGARQDHHVRILQVGWIRGEKKVDIGLAQERVEIGEIG